MSGVGAPRVIGLDVSCKSTGIAWADGRLTTIRGVAVEMRDSYAAAQRSATITNRIAAAIGRQPDRPDFAVVEDYLLLVGFHNGAHTTRRLVEVGACVRMALARLGVPFVEIPPSSLKIFATGGGGADKASMIRAARALGATPRNDDEADAFLLREIGLTAFDNDRFERLDERQRNVVSCVRWPEVAHV